MLNKIHKYSSLAEVVAEVFDTADEKAVSIVCYAETVIQIHRILVRDYCLKKDLEDFDLDFNSHELYEIYFNGNEIDITLLDDSGYCVDIYYAYADCPCGVVDDLKCFANVRVFDIYDADVDDEIDNDELDDFVRSTVENFECPKHDASIYIVINGDVIFN